MKCEDKGRGECSKWEAGRKKSMWFWMSNSEGRRRKQVGMEEEIQAR